MVGNVIVVLSVPASVKVLLTVTVLLLAIVRVAAVAGAVRATLFIEVAVATQRTGVMSVGVLSTTNLVPVPVCEAIAVVLPVLVIGQVKLALVVTVAEFPVIEPAIGLVTSKSVNQPFVTLVAVAPIVVTKRLAHFLRVVPKSSVLSVSETSEVLIATHERFDRAVLAPPAAAASRAREPSAWTVRTSPSLPPEKFISSALGVIVPEAIAVAAILPFICVCMALVTPLE